MKLVGISGDDKDKVLSVEWGIGQQLLITGEYVEADDAGNPIGAIPQAPVTEPVSESKGKGKKLDPIEPGKPDGQGAPT